MSVDLRTRVDTEQAPVEAGRFFRDTLPPLLDAHQDLIAPGACELPLLDFCIETDGEPFSLAWQGDRVEVREGPGGGARVRLTAEQLSDFVNDQSTPVALMSTQLLDMPEGGLTDFLNWWLVLRSAIDGRRIHARGDVTLEGDIRRSFSPDDSDEEMRAFLEEAGYLHIRGLFSEDEMAAVEADFPKAAPHYPKGDLRAWFATTKDGVEHLVRSCTQHMSQPPKKRTRKVLYTGFAQRAVDPEAAERNRRRLNAVRSKTHTSVSQEPGYLGE